MSALGQNKETKSWAGRYIKDFEAYLFLFRMYEVGKTYPEQYKKAMTEMGYVSARDVAEKDRAEVIRAMGKVR